MIPPLTAEALVSLLDPHRRLVVNPSVHVHGEELEEVSAPQQGIIRPWVTSRELCSEAPSFVNKFALHHLVFHAVVRIPTRLRVGQLCVVDPALTQPLG